MEVRCPECGRKMEKFQAFTLSNKIPGIPDGIRFCAIPSCLKKLRAKHGSRTL